MSNPTTTTTTTAHNTYLPGYTPSHVKHHEWRTASNSATYLLPTLHSLPHNTTTPTTLLDIGCGSGTITTSFLAHLSPTAHITATDLSPTILTRAAQHASTLDADYLSRITFLPANIYTLPFPSNSFDIVHAHQVLTHLDSPVQALREMLRVAKPGGTVACREIDMFSWSFWPSTEGLVRFHEVMRETHRLAGGENLAGPKLVGWALEAGARREQVMASMGAWCFSTPEERVVWGGTMAERVRTGEMRKKALEEKVATEAELDAMAEAWDEWIAAEDGCLGCLNGEILIKK